MTEYLDRGFDFADPDMASAFDELSFWSSRFGALLLENLPLERGVRVLDLGCGAGFPLFELAHVLGASCRLVGVDPWAEGIRRAGHKRRVYGLRHAALARADGAALPLADASIDLIVSNLGLNNFDDPPAVLAECVRVSRPGARLAITTNLSGHMREVYAAFREVLEEAGDEAALDRLNAAEARRGTVESVRAMVEGGGFRVEAVVESAFTLRYLDGSALMRHWLTVIGFLGGWRAVAGPEREREWIAALEHRLNAIAAGRGVLEATVPMLYLQARRA